MLETREGGCHCGRVRFRAQAQDPVREPREEAALTNGCPSNSFTSARKHRICKYRSDTGE